MNTENLQYDTFMFNSLCVVILTVFRRKLMLNTTGCSITELKKGVTREYKIVNVVCDGDSTLKNIVTPLEMNNVVISVLYLILGCNATFK